MSDGEGDLEALTALLKDSDDEETTNQVPIDMIEGYTCTDSQVRKEDSGMDSQKPLNGYSGTDSRVPLENYAGTEEMKKKDDMNALNEDQECSLEEITSFLEGSDSEDEALYSEPHNSGKPSRGTTAVESPPVQHNSVIENKVPSGINEIEAKMLKMQEEMMALQAELIKQKQLNSELANKRETIYSRTKNDTIGQEIPKDDALKEQRKYHKARTNHKELKIQKATIQKENSKLSSSGMSSNEEENPFFEKVAEKAESTKKSISVPRNSKQNSPGSREKTVTENITAQSLFGDSDSDWEELDGDKSSTLSDTGQEIRKLMRKGEKERVSHADKVDVQALREKALKASSWKDRPFIGQKQIDPPPKHTSKENDLPSITDPFSNIRIVNPKISSLDMKMKMQDRKLFKLSTLHTRSSADLQGNWVTIGVVVYKSEPRTSASGKTYCLWKLSDLQYCDQVVTFFLFGEVYKQHWKNEVSTVVGLLNPNPMDKAEKASKDVAFTVNHPHQILVMGHSKDLGKCAGTNRAGNACTNIINKQQGEFCTYHVQAAYKRSSSKRTELQGGAAVTPKNHVYKQKKNQQGFFFYGGETFTSMRPAATNSSNLVTVKNLQAKQAAIGKGKLTTMSLHNIEASDQKRLQQLHAKDNALVDLLSTPTVGSMNMIKHLMKKENIEKDQQDDKKPVIQSISAKDLLRQHKEHMRQKLKSSTPGSTPPINPLKVAPVLGKGCNDGLINLDAPRVPKLSAMKAEEAKKRAILQIQEKGGIQKEDPNAVRKKSSPEARDRILKRVRADFEKEDRSESVEEPQKKKSKLLGNIDENSEEFKALMKTKSRHTGALKEAEKEIEEKYFMELEKKERYEEKMSSIMEMKCTVFTCKIVPNTFQDTLGKIEQFRLLSSMERIKEALQCKYTSFKTTDRCKEEHHPITKVQATKRFFKCRKCGKRTISIHKLPQDPCRGCGENNYERTSMLQERKGPKLPRENLSIRGDEAKFLNSMDQKNFLNL